MARKKIVLIGCGNIGSRHLQAAAKLPFPCTVQVVEPNETSQELAKSRLADVAYDRNAHDFHWHKSIQDLKGKSDLTIVATSAAGRGAVISDLVNSGHSRFLIEKMVCQSEAEYRSLLSTIEASEGKAWVNTPRRYYKSYLRIREHFHNQPIHLSVVAGNEGLGSNAIHFLDLFSWFSGDYKAKLGGDFLFDKLFPNKRGPDFLEFAGYITGASPNGSSLNISFFPFDEHIPLTVSIVSRDTHVVINETNAKIFNLAPKNHPLGEDFQNEFVSDTTTQIASDIISKDECLLASLEDSFVAHSELFRIFNAHIEKLTGEKKELCPIT